MSVLVILVIFLYLLQNTRVGKGLRDYLAQCVYPVGEVVEFRGVTGPDPGDRVRGRNTRPEAPYSLPFNNIPVQVSSGSEQ